MSGSSNTPGRTGGFGNSSGGLSPHDRKLLSAALEAGRSLERALASQGLSSKRLSSKRLSSKRLASEDSLSANLNFDIAELEAEFRKHLVALDTGDSALVKKQAEYAPKVDASLGEKHLAVLLVPLERLLGRAARDEEFLYLEGDRTELSPDALAIKNSQPRIVICENLRSAFNVGAIFRTGECFLANQIWLTGYTAPPVKTAMGTENLVPWKSVAHTKDAITEAKSLGYQVVALEVTPDATPLDQFQWPEKAALVLGNERFGLDSETLSACDHVVKVPTSGLKNSLNVGIAFGIASATWRRSATPTQLASQAFAAAASASAASASVKTISPIGYIKGGYVSPQSTPRQGSYARTPSTPGESARADTEAEVVLEAKFDGQPANFEQALKELEGFSHIWLLFGFHHSQSWLPQVRPPRGDGSLKGVFATRAPHRPNGLGLSCVRLLGIKGRTLRISHHDLLQGTPIYDIKPYVPEADAFPDAEAGWISALPAPHPLVESEVAREKLDWLSQEGESRLRDFLFEQLRYQPFDLSRKRIEILPAPANAPTTPSANTAKDMPSDAPNRPSDKSPAMHPGGATLSPIHFIAAFRTWRFHAALTPTADSSGTITITDVTSGYSDQDLRDPSDPYGDKDLHRRFHARH